MSFSLESWREAATERLGTIGDWLHQRRVQDAPYLLYGALCGLSIWPLLEAAQSGQFLPAMMGLGGVAGGVGGNLLAEQVQRWKDQAGAVDEVAVVSWVEETASEDPDLRDALDSVLERLEVISQAQVALDEEARTRFVATLREELSRLGNLARFEATLSGSGAQAVGPGAQAGSDGAVVSRGAIHAPVATTGGMAAGRNLVQARDNATVIIGDGEAVSQAAARKTALARYLRGLRLLCNALPLAALTEEEGAHRRAEITLNRVYISLNTTTQVPLSDEDKGSPREELDWRREEARPLPALEAAASERRLVILGDPGSGKSTFVNYLAYLLASARLEEADGPEGWPHGPLLPIRILLRELVADLPADEVLVRLSAEKRARRLADRIWGHVARELAETHGAEEALPALREAIDCCQALVIFDGLDEVASERQGVAREAVEAFGRLCGENRVLVTCRVRSYRAQPPLQPFVDVTLAPFDEPQIDEFVRRWYGALSDLGALKRQEAKRRAGDLRASVRSLLELARNPLLLTTMAVVHTAQVELPRERARLYQRCVDILLRRWHKHKAGEAPLLAQLDISESEILAALREVAYLAHGLGGTEEQGDLPRSEVIKTLAGPLGSYGRAEIFLEYVDTRAGLLVGRGGGKDPTYTFPHRTFQEYLAGCHLALGGRDFGRRLRGLLGEGERWTLAARLGAEHLLYNVGHLTPVLDAAYTLCPVAEPHGQADWRGVLWAGQFAAELGTRKVAEDREKRDGGQAFLDRLIPRLVAILREERLGAIERAAAGRVLAELGDTRSGVGLDSATGLPDITWCEVPGGPFLMGSEKAKDAGAYGNESPQRKVVLHGFQIARYPVTNAQFQAFVRAGGYDDEQYWSEASAAGVWGNGTVKAWNDAEPREGPADFGDPYNCGNHPVVGLTWYEALAFCRWLTDRLHDMGRIEPGHEVRLPTEAEWEKAARGTEGILYPWGDGFDEEKCNTGATGIGTPSAVGCFPDAASAYGVEDLSGNGWEWTQSLYKSYPYDADDGREKLDNEGPRVLRGGSFNNDQRRVRCASRASNVPRRRYGSFGFRCVVAPEASGL